MGLFGWLFGGGTVPPPPAAPAVARAPASVPLVMPAGRPAIGPAFPADLAKLGAYHAAFANAYQWRVGAAGVDVRGKGVLRSPGNPDSVRRAWAWFGPEITAAAVEYLVPVELLIACLCAESVGGARQKEDAAGATRHEPGFVSNETTPGRVSTGAMQTLVTTARDVLGDPTLSAAALYDPRTSLRAGAAYIARQARQTGFDPPLVGAAYNAGSVRCDTAAANPWGLVCYPLGTGAHVTRFTSFFNDAVAVLHSAPALVGAHVPSFASRFTTPG